jgi:hypothetical protein
LFDHLEQQICDHLPKKVKRLESECERLKTNKFYLPQLRLLKVDAFKEQVYAALADGPKTKTELARMFGKTYGAISSVGLRLRNEGKIRSIWRDGRFKWARGFTEPAFIPARDAVLTALKTGPMTIPALARATGKSAATVKSALQNHLLKNGSVMRSRLGTYALVGRETPYISKCDAIIATLNKGPMNIPALAQLTCTTPSSLYQFIDLLLAKGRIIRTRDRKYALRGTAPVFVPTCDAILRALGKKQMKLGPLVKEINRSTKSSRSRGTFTAVLRRLKMEGSVKQDRWGGEYRLAGRTSRRSA